MKIQMVDVIVKLYFEDHSDTTLAQLQVSHDGTTDDTKGAIIFSTHNGTTLNEALRIDSSQNVGLGTTTPQSKLDIEGNVAIGTTYSGTSAAPTNGLLVEGSVGIGTNSPKNKLDVNGAMVVGSSYSGSTTASANCLLIEGSVGIGEINPETKLHITDSEPYLTLKNLTDEFSNEGCESRIIFEDHSNTILAQLQVSHDGVVDDTKGNMIFSTHDGTTLSEALRIDSAQNTNISGDLLITGDLIITGTTVTQNSTQVTIENPVFTIGGENDATSDDNMDRGILFKWHNGTDAKKGFFGYDDSDSVFTFFNNATITNGVIGGDIGNVKFNNGLYNGNIDVFWNNYIKS